MEPYVYDGKYGSGRMAISQNSKEQKLAAVGVSGALPAYVAAEDLAEIAANLYEACGLPSPVILNRSEFNPGRSLDRIGDVHVGHLGGKVTVGLYQVQPETLTPAYARELAALIALHADEAEGEPDPEEVDELAHAIRLGLFPDSVQAGLRPSDSDRQAARAALRWMNAKGKRDA
jgi:hypothetical protein